MTTAKKTRNRNPAFPWLDLEAALERAEALHKKEAHKPMMPETAAKHWGGSLTSSVAQQNISSLKQYGLLVDEKVGTMRKLRLSDLALKILLDKRGTNDRLQALQEAALLPKIHSELWSKAEDGLLASDEEMEHYLTLGRKQRFFSDSVNRVIENFKSSIKVAKLEYRDIMDEDGDENPPSAVKVGDFVQWTSQDQQQFAEPRCVTGISDDGEWAFVEGAETGLPIKELDVAEAPVADAGIAPRNPHYKDADTGGAIYGDAWSSKDGIRLKFPFGSGNELVIIMRKQVSKKEFDSTVKAVFNLSSAAFIDNRLQDGPESNAVGDDDGSK